MAGCGPQALSAMYGAGKRPVTTRPFGLSLPTVNSGCHFPACHGTLPACRCAGFAIFGFVLFAGCPAVLADLCAQPTEVFNIPVVAHAAGVGDKGGCQPANFGAEPV